jgi:hypothetical protein
VSEKPKPKNRNQKTNTHCSQYIQRVPIDLKRSFAAANHLRGLTIRRTLLRLMRLWLENPNILPSEEGDE